MERSPVRWPFVVTLAFAGVACQRPPAAEWQEATARVLAESDPFFVDPDAKPGSWTYAMQEAKPDSGLRASSPACGGLLARETTNRIMANVRDLERLRPAFLALRSEAAEWQARLGEWEAAFVAADPALLQCAECAVQRELVKRMADVMDLVAAHLELAMRPPTEGALVHRDVATGHMLTARVVGKWLMADVEGSGETPLPEGTARQAVLPTIEALAASAEAWDAFATNLDDAFGYFDNWHSLRDHHAALLASCYPRAAPLR